MKNLKKVLSLVLALAMALSLMTVAFAKDANDFADYSKVDYNEAVDVMVAAGVFDGVENNNFNPTAVLTREQAAKIVTYMIIGADAADKLTTTVAPYADVAANRWSAGAIAWCTERGILAGSNGKFNPTGELTGLAFSKMLLVALGYDAEIEKLVGSSWAINAATLAIENDLDESLEAISLSSVLTREQACQMAFNTMKADLVKYDSKGTNITLSDGTSVIVGASAAEPYLDRNATTALGAANTQFAEKYCQKLRLEATSADAFGRPAVEWSYNGTSVGTYAKTATTSYEGEVTKGTLYSLLGSSIADKAGYYYTTMEGGKTGYKLTQYVDGVKQNSAIANYLVSGSSDAANNTVKGATTEVFVDSDAKTITVATVNTYVAQAVADYSTANKSLAIANLSAGVTIPTKIDNDDFDVTGYAEDDYILYTVDKKTSPATIKSIAKAEVVTGTVGTYVTGSSPYVTVGGTKYSYSANVASKNGGSAASYAVGEEATVVLDKQGNVIVVDALAAANTNFVFVQNAGDGDARGTYAIADLTSTDGKESTATLKSISTNGGSAVDTQATLAALNAGWYTYSMSGDKYKLAVDTSKQYYATVSSGALVTNGAIAINCTSPAGQNQAGKANSKTVFVIKDADDNVTVYEGIAKVPTITASSSTTAYYYNDGDTGYAKYVYIDVAKTATIDDKTASNDDVFYILKQSGKVVAADDNEYYTLDVLKNGEVVKLDVETGASDLADSVGKIVYKLKVNSKNQGASATEVVLNTDPTTCKLVDSMSNYYVSYSNNVLTLKDSSSDKHNLVVTDDAVIYVVVNDVNLKADPAASYEVQTLTAKQLAGFVNGRAITGGVTGFTTASDSNTYKTIYMTITSSVTA